MNIEKRLFGKLANGHNVNLYLIKTRNMHVSLTDYGAAITSILAKDKFNNLGEITLGLDKLSDYLTHKHFFGATVGRNCNRIGKGRLKINDTEYKLELNEGNNHLHGGFNGFNKVLWESEVLENNDEIGVSFNYLSKDGEGGYPGNLQVKITYTITNNSEIIIQYEATTDKTTICNLTNHTYFNLKDGGITDILDHLVKIYSSKITEIDQESICTGKISNTEGSAFDFKEFKRIRNGIFDDCEQIKNGNGFDHNFILQGSLDNLKLGAEVIEENCGRHLKVFTTEPGIQFYSGNSLEELTRNEKVNYNFRSGFCLETQHYPDTPNHPHFPQTILRPGEVYKSKTIYKFAIIE